MQMEASRAQMVDAVLLSISLSSLAILLFYVSQLLGGVAAAVP